MRSKMLHSKWVEERVCTCLWKEIIFLFVLTIKEIEVKLKHIGKSLQENVAHPNLIQDRWSMKWSSHFRLPYLCRFVSLLKKKKYACKEKYNLLGTTTTLHVGRHAKNINYYLKHFVDTPCTIFYTRTTHYLRGYDPFLRCHTVSNHTTYTTRSTVCRHKETLKICIIFHLCLDTVFVFFASDCSLTS